MFDESDDLVERVARELRRPVVVDPARKARVMALVRGAAADGFPRRRRRARRGGWISASAGLLLAASVAGVVAMGAARGVGRAGAAVASAGAGDTVVSTIRDTLRLVRFMLVAPNAARVAVAGDFNRWSASATPLAAAESTGVWTATVALARGRHQYAFVVDDTQWVRAPAGGPTIYVP